MVLPGRVYTIEFANSFMIYESEAEFTLLLTMLSVGNNDDGIFCTALL